MGIKGFMTYVEKNESDCIEYIDLVERARQLGEMEIIVDYYSFQNHFYFIFLDCVCNYYRNKYFHIPGGEYWLLYRWFYKFVTDLKSLGINLVFYIDGSKGSSEKHTQAKMDTWRYRHNKSCDTMLKYVEICNGRASVSSLEENEFIRPPLLEVAMREMLRDTNCEVVQIAFGEADYIIAQQLSIRPRAFAVLSGDSDFAVFRDCVLIPLKYFDLKNDFGMKPPTPNQMIWNGVAEPDKPLRLIVGLISTARMTKALKFSSSDQLIDLSIINGNDFTSPIIRAEYRKWNELFKIKKKNPNHRYPSIEEYRDFIRQCPDGQLWKSDAYKEFCKYNRRFAAACAHSRDFYLMMLNETEARYKPGQITHHLEKTVPSMMGMHFGFYWHRLLVEDPSYTPIEILLSDLRRYVYQVLAGRGLSIRVSEFGRSQTGKLDSATVHGMGHGLGLPNAESVEIQAVNRNLRSLSRIMVMQEYQYFGEDLLRKYGWKSGFLSMVLRFFLTLNWRQHLCIDEEEFMTIIAMSFGVPKLNLEFYYSMPVKPNLRCITIYNWLQDVYRHCFEFLGKLLRIDHEAPKPHECFSCAMFTCFFMVRHPEKLPHITEKQIERIRRERFQIIKERKHMIRSLTVGHFEFDDCFW